MKCLVRREDFRDTVGGKEIKHYRGTTYQSMSDDSIHETAKVIAN